MPLNLDNTITSEDASELACWINNLELALGDLQHGVVDFFAADDSCSRRQLLEQVINQQQLWGKRPVDHIQKLYGIKKEI